MYAHIVFMQGDHRVVRCKDGLQWIVQKSSGERWVNLAFCATHSGLHREWTSRVEGPLPHPLAILPDHISKERTRNDPV